MGTRSRALGLAVVALSMLTASSIVAPQQARGDDDPDRAWASIDVATGYVDNVLGCTWKVCGDPASAFRQNYESRGFMLLDLDTVGPGQRPGPGWWYVDGTFIRDSFERNVSATARILGVELRWSTGGLGTDTGAVTFTVDVAPTGQRFTTTGSSLIIDPLDAGVEHTFTVTATRDDGSTVEGPAVTATPKVDPDPECTDRSVARECRAATNWATVDPETMLVVNVSVCTPWQCGVDGEWGGRMPANSSWPNFLLIELDGPGGIGWKYVDGAFVDVRPREEPEPADEVTDPATGGTTEPNGPDPTPEPEPEPEPDDAATEPDEATEAAEAEPAPSTEPEPELEGDAPGTSSSGPTAAASDDDASAAEESIGATSATDANEPEQGPVRRVIAGIVSFLRGLFGN